MARNSTFQFVAFKCSIYTFNVFTSNLTGIYLLKINSRNTVKRYEISAKLTKKDNRATQLASFCCLYY